MHTIIAVPIANIPAADSYAEAMQREIDGTDGGKDTFLKAPRLFAADALDDTAPLYAWVGVKLSEANRATVESIKASLGALVADYDMATQPGFPAEFLAANNLRTALSHLT